MRRFVMALALLLGGRLAGATPTVVVHDQVGCCVSNSRGEDVCISARIYVATQVLVPGAPVGTGPLMVHCEGDQGFPAGRLIRFEGVSEVDGPAGPLTGRWMELITPRGHIYFDWIALP